VSRQKLYGPFPLRPPGGRLGLKEWIIPQEKVFFDLLEAIAGNLVSGAFALDHFVKDYRDVPAKRKRLKDLEHLGDVAVHEVYEALNRTFITPIDREDITALASRMDDALDMIYAAGHRLELYEIQKPTKPMLELADVILKSCEKIEEAVGLIHALKNGDRIEALCVEINGLENVADDLLNTAVAALFKSNDPILIIKLKEVYENMEAATDRCEDVANILSDIVAKNR